MAGSTMFNIAYGLKCDSNEDPLIIRTENYLPEISHAVSPTQFLVVSTLFQYTHDKSFDISNLIECVSSFEVSSFLVTRWIVQEGDQAFG
jgi:hypothetical protein